MNNKKKTKYFHKKRLSLKGEAASNRRKKMIFVLVKTTKYLYFHSNVCQGAFAWNMKHPVSEYSVLASLDQCTCRRERVGLWVTVRRENAGEDWTSEWKVNLISSALKKHCSYSAALFCRNLVSCCGSCGLSACDFKLLVKWQRKGITVLRCDSASQSRSINILKVQRV